jgi:signal transduction histidine kinase
VTNFIMYGKPPEPQKTAVRIPDLLDSVLRMAGDRLRSQHIRVQREYRECGEIPADPDMIRRAVMNLVGNAVDAMPTGGTLTVSAGPQGDGRYAVAIVDTGLGIERKDRERIFEPYFTTKESGIGLGLVLTKKIVDAHDGEIRLDSTPGKGTRVEFVLPRGAEGSGAA